MEKQKRKINILINVEEEFIAKAKYVLEFFCKIAGVNPQFYEKNTPSKIHVYYGYPNENEYPIRIFYSKEFENFFKNKAILPDHKFLFSKEDDEYIPFLFSQQGDICTVSSQKMEVRKDIVASAFYFLSCWQEYVAEDILSPTQRFPFSETHQFRLGFADIPVVDIYAKIFYRALIFVFPEMVKSTPWPENKKIAISVSHDIDYWIYWTNKQLSEVLSYNFKRILKSPIKASYKLIGHFIDKKILYKPRNKIKRIILKEKLRDIKSTYFILTRNDFGDERKNYFNIEKYKKTITNNLSGSYHAELHGSPESAFDSKQLAIEITNLREQGFPARGYRSHNLAFSYHKTFKLLESQGIKFDCSLGFWEHIGYRAGTSFPFTPYNIEENRPFNIVEIPLIVMDVTLYSKIAMKMGVSEAKEVLRKTIEKAKKYNSHISLLWHPRTFDNVDFPGWEALFWDITHFAGQNNAWICSSNELYDFWRIKNN